MPTSIQYQTPEQPTSTDHATSRLRTVTGSRWPRKCACGCAQDIPRGANTRLVVDFGAQRPYPAYLVEHSPDYRGVRARASPAKAANPEPDFVPASKLLVDYERQGLIGRTDEDASLSPEAGRAWASGQLVFNCGQFESARSAFADYARPGETAAQLRARANRTILEDLEQKVIALRGLHAKLRDMDMGESFGDVVGRSRPG